MTRRACWSIGTTVGLIWGMGCGSSQPNVKPTDMSAEEHRAEAQHERELAQEDAHQYRPSATGILPVPPPSVFGNSNAGDQFPAAGIDFPMTVYNPTEGYLAQADQHRKHARAHEKAAAALEKFEEGACRQFPERTRAACPLLAPVTKIDDIGHGVRVSFAPGTRVDALTAHMRCHYAYAKAHGFDATVSCPLYMPGLEIKQASPAAVEITIKNDAAVAELRARSREEAAFVPERPN